jgi:hypothetical protein
MVAKFVAGSLVGAMLVLSPHFASAQQGGNLPASTVSSFVANPSQLLTQFPNGGPGMGAQVRGLLQTDRSTLSAVVGLLASSNEAQRKMIAETLAQIAKQYSSSEPAFANQIQQAVANSGLQDVIRAYAEVAGDTGTAATGAGGGGGGAGGTGGGGPNTAGAPTGGNNSGGNATGNNAVQTQANGLSSASLGTIGGSTDGTTGTTTTTTNTTTNTTITQISTF